MSGLDDSAKAYAKRCGENAAAASIEAIPELEWVPDSEAEHYDARVTEPIGPTGQLPLVGCVELTPGTPVEIKSVSVVYGEDTQANGRFYLRENQHENLLQDGGVYLFLVCSPNPNERDILAMKIVEASNVTELVPSWIDSADRAVYAQMAWTRVFDESEVETA
jgi:hypothetical protein